MRGVKTSRDRGFRLSECLSKHLIDVTSTNIVSAIVRAFITCFESYPNRARERYVTAFSREVSIKLGDLYKCENVQPVLQEIAKQLDEVYEGLKSRSDEYSHVVLMKFKTIGRLSIHTRSPYLPLEIAISWDPILNIPFIPATSLKGVARWYFEVNNIVIDNLRPSDIFGSTEDEGIVLFSDAYPTSCEGARLIEAEVLTPHYSEVDNRIDEASSKPIPLIFPVIAANITFSFIVAIRRIKGISTSTVMKILDNIAKSLGYGIGAKTALGYGRVKVF